MAQYSSKQIQKYNDVYDITLEPIRFVCLTLWTSLWTGMLEADAFGRA